MVAPEHPRWRARLTRRWWVNPRMSGHDRRQGSAVGADRFRGRDDEYPGHWTDDGAPSHWDSSPDSETHSAAIRRLVTESLRLLPPAQRSVVSLRDVHGMTCEEVCNRLRITPAHQRVLLHQGRATLRAALEDHYARPAGGA